MAHYKRYFNLLFFVGLINFNFISLNINAMQALDPSIKQLIHMAWGFWFDTDEAINRTDSFPTIFTDSIMKQIIDDLSMVGESLSSEELQQNQKELKKYFEEQEKTLATLKESLEVSPFGNINYAMTSTEMKHAIKNQFKILKQNGVIISQEEFEKVKDLYYRGHSKSSIQSTDLSRIWGAEYLKRKINESDYLKNKYDTPKYVIVLDNEDLITVKLWFDIRFPVVGKIENARIYFQNIKGVPVGSSNEVVKDIGKETIINYIDLCNGPLTAFNSRQNENVIKESSSQKCYIVDTEFSSFIVKLNNSSTGEALRYGAKKFEYFKKIQIEKSKRNPKQLYPYTFNVKDLEI